MTTPKRRRARSAREVCTHPSVTASTGKVARCDECGAPMSKLLIKECRLVEDEIGVLALPKDGDAGRALLDRLAAAERDLAEARAASLAPLDTRREGEDGERGITFCKGCGEERDEPHAWSECARSLGASIDHLTNSLINADNEMRIWIMSNATIEELKEAIRNYLVTERIHRTSRMPDGERVIVNGVLANQIEEQARTRIGKIAIAVFRSEFDAATTTDADDAGRTER